MRLKLCKGYEGAHFSPVRGGRRLWLSCWLVGSRVHHLRSMSAHETVKVVTVKVVRFWFNDAGAAFGRHCHVLDWRGLFISFICLAPVCFFFTRYCHEGCKWSIRDYQIVLLRLLLRWEV